jgi:carboxypeptidase Taq
MGISPELDGNILGGGVSSGIHESQSRLWENRVGRGKPFWDHFYPVLCETFPHFKSVAQDAFLRAINKVEPGLIRVDADELTYNLHVMIRFDFECQMMEGKLAIKDLPEAWNARYKADLGVTVPNLKDGCLQDVHWFGGRLGYFQGYTIGNILSAQFYDAAEKKLGRLDTDFAKGDFSRLRGWLREHLHQFGASKSPDALVLNATGSPMTIRPYMNYLTQKYKP